MDLTNISKMIKADNKMELPLYFPPPIYYSLYAAVRLSIILAHTITHDWFYSNFIQLHFRKTKNPRDHVLHIFPIEYMVSWDYTGASLFFYETYINENVMKIDHDNLIPLTMNWITNGYYIITRVDVSKLKGTSHYQRTPLTHTMIAYGFDKQRKILKHIDFDNKNNLSKIDINFADFQNAFFSEHLPGLLKAKRVNTRQVICLCMIKPDIKYQLNINNIKQLLTDYRNSINTTKVHNFLIPETSGVFGVSIYEELIKHTEMLSQQKQYIDYRAFHVIYEHKKNMVRRLQYLEEKGFLPLRLQFSEKFFEIEKIADSLRHDVIKYVINKENNFLKKICNSLRSIREQEIPLINEIIACL